MRLVFCANQGNNFWSISNNNAYLDRESDFISLRRTNGSGEYVRAGDYFETDFISQPRKVSYLKGFFGLDVDYENCVLGFRISNDGGETWRIYDSENNVWKQVLGSAEGNMTYYGNIPLGIGLGDDPSMAGWMSEYSFHEGITSLSIGEKNIAVWINMRPENNISKPIFNKLVIYADILRDNYLNDAVRSISLFFQDNFYFDDRIITEVDRSTSYQLPYMTVVGEDTGPEGKESCRTVEYVRAYNVSNDPDKHEDIVKDWNEDGLVEFEEEQDGYVEFNFGNKPSVHIQTDPIVQLTDEVSIILSEIGLEEWGPYEKITEQNLYNMKSRVYLERWAETTLTVILQAHRTEQVMRMEEGLRRMLENYLVFSEGTGKIFNWTLMGDVTSPFDTTSQLSVSEFPLRFGRYRAIGNIEEGDLVSDVNYNVVTFERSI